MRHTAHVAHHSPGRLRIRVPSAKNNPAELEQIQRSLSKLAGVHEVLINESIGTVTIHYDAKIHPDFQRHLANEPAAQEAVAVSAPPRFEDMGEVDEMIEHEAEFLAQHSDAAKAIVDSMRKVDRALMRATGNAVDLKVVTPLALAAAVFMELGVAAATPVWLTLGLFSFNHFIELHSHGVRDAVPPESDTQSKTSRAAQRKKVRQFP